MCTVCIRKCIRLRVIRLCLRVLFVNHVDVYNFVYALVKDVHGGDSLQKVIREP